MNPLHFIVEAFVNTFGITHPSPAKEVSAGAFIALMLLGLLLFLIVGAWILHLAFTH